MARWLRPAGTALRIAVGGSTSLARDLAAADDGLRLPVSTSRRIAVVQVDGGAGATTLVVRVGTALARRRRGAGVLAVDAARGPAALASAARVDSPLSLAQSRSRTSGVVTAAQARAAVPRSAAGLAVLGAGTAEHEGWPAPFEAWRSAVDPVARFFDVVVTDWGVRGDDAELAQVAEAHHVVVVVSRTDRGNAERALHLAGRAVALGAARVAMVLTDVGGTGGATDELLRRQLADRADVPVLTVPHEPLAPGRPLAVATRRAYAGVGARLVALSRETGQVARPAAPPAAHAVVEPGRRRRT
ncbi:hypothetical protein [Cellulomonas fimi]|uniref:MinD-like ATPase involved in chromosome partitioning or flagellar assembly n=1 Tax=Cellulomonas fimi TaxID=1708 RepID=A0A7Y0M341_CELFI|nr:hypothetical protein [Cellulomonas fimi]NMR21607.1 hypothetical protein [Cellulomonas fimi]